MSQRERDRIEREGYLIDCWLTAYQPKGSARTEKTYYRLESREPQFDGKRRRHVPADQRERVLKLIANGRKRGRTEKPHIDF